MQAEFEGILARLTDSQISLMVNMVQTLGMVPVESVLQHDLDALEGEELIEYSESVDHKDSYTAHRETTAYGGGRPRPSELGGKWVKWYLARRP